MRQSVRIWSQIAHAKTPTHSTDATSHSRKNPRVHLLALLTVCLGLVPLWDTVCPVWGQVAIELGF